MRRFLKHFFLIMTFFYLGTIFLSEDARFELPSAMMFMVALFGFLLTATTFKREVE